MRLVGGQIVADPMGVAPVVLVPAVATGVRVVDGQIVSDPIAGSSAPLVPMPAGGPSVEFIGGVPVLTQEPVPPDSPIAVGPRGLQGLPGDGSTAPILQTDYTDVRFQYVGFAAQIKRLDYSVSPVLVQSSSILDINVSWPLRASLVYS